MVSMGYFGWNLMATNEPTIKPIETAVSTMDQDFAPSNFSRATKGPSTFACRPRHHDKGEADINHD